MSSIPKNPSSASFRCPFLVEPWILLCVYLNCAGWVLSALRQLNAVGYTGALLLGAGALAALRPDWGRIRLSRFQHGFPLGFLILATLAILGGFLHPPNNYDGLAYRVPRILHWLSEGQWHWIPTEFSRLNTRSVGWEWIAAPILALTHSFRWLFLTNALAFLLLPGLIFSVFTRMGVRPRVAWYWMWLLPTGYCFLLQAGSIGNDMITAVPALAAVDFALRAHASRKVSHVWLSILSAALMTGFKMTNLPLLLAWVIALMPVAPLARKYIFAAAGVLVFSVGASFLPLAAVNQKYANDWAGVRADTFAPFAFRIPVNAILLLEQNFAPPIFPVANRWNAMVARLVPQTLTHQLEHSFEKGAAHFTLPEMAMEESAGMGFGLSFLLLLSVSGPFFLKNNNARPYPLGLYAKCLLAAPWVGVFYLMNQSGAASVARWITAYYPLLLPLLLLHRNQNQMIRTRWWRIAAAICMGIAFVPVIISPARPLWPAQAILAKVGATHSSNPLLQRAYSVYSVYGDRSAGFAPVRAHLPPNLKTLGFLSHDDPEASLWMPWGTVKVVHVTRNENAEDLRRQGIEYILANPEKASNCVGQSLESWMTKLNLQKVESIPLWLRVSQGSLSWQLLKLPPEQ